MAKTRLQHVISPPPLQTLSGTKTISFCPRSASTSSLPASMAVGSGSISFTNQVKDLGFHIYFDLNMNKHTNTYRKPALNVNASIQDTRTRVTSYYSQTNSLPTGSPRSAIHHLQTVQTSTARLIFRSTLTQTCTPPPHPYPRRELRLTVDWCIKYKRCCLSFKVVTVCAPDYLSGLFKCIHCPAPFIPLTQHCSE